MRTIDELKLSENDEKAIKEASGILKDKFPVDAVILFGSVARQEKDLESDIDLLVLTTRTITWQERKSIIDTLFEIQRKYRVLFSPLIIENHEWKEGPLSLLPIHREIDKDGITT